jgi:hypothetical protein
MSLRFDIAKIAAAPEMATKAVARKPKTTKTTLKTKTH